MTLAKWIGLTVLFISSLSAAVNAQVISQRSVAKTERNHLLKERFESLLPQLHEGNINSLTQGLKGLNELHREYLLYLFCHEALNYQDYNEATRIWLNKLSQQDPRSQVETAAGLVKPAFDYPTLAKRALRGWRVANQHLEYHKLLSQGALDVKAIFNPNNPFIRDQQDSLIRVMPMQNPRQIRWLEKQFDRQDLYFPDNQMLANIAMLGGSEEYYYRLWKKPVDQYSMKATEWVKNDFATVQAFELLKIAAANPELTEHAWQIISELNPMPKAAQKYLVQGLNSEDMGEVAAQVLAQLNDREILAQLVKLITENEYDSNFAQNAWLSLVLNPSIEAKRLIKQLFQQQSIRDNFGPKTQR